MELGQSAQNMIDFATQPGQQKRVDRELQQQQGIPPSSNQQPQSQDTHPGVGGQDSNVTLTQTPTGSLESPIIWGSRNPGDRRNTGRTGW
jgi:hypothetical protein